MGKPRFRRLAWGAVAALLLTGCSNSSQVTRRTFSAPETTLPNTSGEGVRQ